MAPTTQWFVRNNQRVFGPFTPKQLKQLADSGKLTPGMEVRDGAAGKWLRAAKLRGLFTAEQLAAVAGGVIKEEVVDEVEVVDEAELIEPLDLAAVPSTASVEDDPFLAGTASSDDQPWVELSDVAFNAPVVAPVAVAATAAGPILEQAPTKPLDANKVAQDYLDKAAVEVADYHLHAHKSRKLSGDFGTWAFDAMLALSIGSALYFFLCGIFAALPLGFMARKAYDAGDDSKTIAFLVVVALILVGHSAYVVYLWNTRPELQR